MSDSVAPNEITKLPPRWRPLNAIDRRVLGVLGEKAKTTPDVYPMSLNGVVTGCNQKSNRAPVLQLESEQVDDSLDRLRECGAVALVEGSGRVQKYRHYLYEWLGVGKVELSVMIELLLRGPQTEGELRGRVSRMDPIDDLTVLRGLLASLKEKGLVIPLTPEGRGQVFTHALYPQRDLENQKAHCAQAAATNATASDDAEEQPIAHAAPAQQRTTTASPPAQPVTDAGVIELLQQKVEELRTQGKYLVQTLAELTEKQSRLEGEFEDLKRSLGG